VHLLASSAQVDEQDFAPYELTVSVSAAATKPISGHQECETCACYSTAAFAAADSRRVCSRIYGVKRKYMSNMYRQILNFS
jgi:hypothetical protein